MAQGWGNDGRLASKRLYRTSGGTDLSRLTYGYDNDDNIVSITDGVDASKSVTYGYDKVDRLAQSVASTGSVKRQDFLFDLNGNLTKTENRTNASDTSPVSTATYATASGKNRLASVADASGTRSISYDGRGNTSAETRPGSVSVSVTYDGFGRLTGYTRTGSPALSHTYNGLDDRVSTAGTSGGTTDLRRFVYDADGRLLGEYGTGVTDVKAETIWLSPTVDAAAQPFGGDDGVAGYAPLAVVTGGAVYWVHGSHLGVPLVTTNTAGNSAAPTGYTRTGLPGQTQTLSDLYYNRYRDYDSATSRYIQADPIGLDGGNNIYAYAANNPIRFTDPMGLCPMCLVIPAVCAGGGCEALGALGLGALWWATHPFDLRKSPYDPPRSPPRSPAGPNCDSDGEDHCEVQYETDIGRCTAARIKYGKNGFAQCASSALRRRSQCENKQQLEPLTGVDRPLYRN